MSAIRYVHLTSGEPLPPLSLPPFKAIIVAEDTADDGWRKDVSEWLIRSNCLYLCTWGDACEAWHDNMDDANIGEFEGGTIPDDRFVMTTWHAGEPLSEAFWFAGICAEHPTVELRHTLIVHIAPRERGDALLEQYRSAIVE
ncbi:DUF7684 family protein [Sphingomonas alpina]|uniref:DUF7684 domain-containing protein n=1 Tax=Sphingomonas alpina TaxID=653931 RepID=A0A7H0LLA0_9SPHN|nr:hypothetical protein [Sphingomonas alpina]QNQ10453.1 hypothetical protein H3Z74_04310 [Sphingomonas alpina]